MNTKKLFAIDRYLKTCYAKVTSITLQQDDTADIILDQTIFFPTGGGQSCDKGTINDLSVTDVYENESVIHHKIKINNPDSLPSAGDTVSCELNWAHRFLNMQRHCGEHILSGIIDREFGGVNRGFHMGSDYMTIDISLEKTPEYNSFTPDMLSHAELLANKVIWDNAPITVRFFKTKEEANNVPVRKPLVIEKDISIVCVGSIDNPSDCVACCGTHPNTAGSVGLIKIYKVEPCKGMFRIYFDAGKNALEVFSKQYTLISDICKHFSASDETLIEKIKIQEGKEKKLKDELFAMKNQIEESIFLRIEKIYKENYQSGKTTFISIAENHIDKNILGNLGKRILDLPNAMIALCQIDTQALSLMCASELDCSYLLQDAKKFNAKGGGSKSFLTIKFENIKELDAFIDALAQKFK